MEEEIAAKANLLQQEQPVSQALWNQCKGEITNQYQLPVRNNYSAKSQTWLSVFFLNATTTNKVDIGSFVNGSVEPATKHAYKQNR